MATIEPDYPGLASPEATISRAADALRDGFGAEGVSILVHDPAQKSLLFKVVRGGAEHLVGVAVPEDTGVAGWAFRNGLVYVPDCAADERFFSAVDHRSGMHTRSLLATPFGYDGAAIGVVELVNLPPQAWEGAAGRQDLQRMLTMATALIGTAYAAASLHDSVRQKSAALAQANQHLEAVVEKRTRRLREALSRLKSQNEFIEKARHQAMHSEKMAAIGQLAAGVAHEINNPIGFIASNLNTARDYWDSLHGYLQRLETANPDVAALYRKRFSIDLIEEDGTRLIEECLEGTARVTTIVRNLKEFVHHGERLVAEIDVHQLIDRTVSIAVSPYKHKVSIVREYRGPRQWRCNPQELGQVVLNLVVNAAQAIERTGEIRLRTALDDDRFCIDIEDTGAGIPDEILGKIFEPFFTTKEVGLGTGLGLSTCFHLIKQIGGDIHVRSAVGEGTVFRVSLPLLAEASDGPAALAAAN